MKNPDSDWLYEISPKGSLFSFNFAEIWRYRDLLVMFVRRDIVTYYKQTILGPIWFVVQPILTSLVQYIIFNQIAQIKSDEINYFLFVLAGNTLWGYFSDSFNSTSNTCPDQLFYLSQARDNGSYMAAYNSSYNAVLSNCSELPRVIVVDNL